MKKTILKLLRGDGSEANNNALDRKELRKAACKLHLEIEAKADRKEKFNESLSKLETRGKIVIEDSVVKLKAKSVQCNEKAADVCDSTTASKERKDKKRKVLEEVPEAAVEKVDKVSKKKKTTETVDDTEKKAKSDDVSTTTTAVSDGTESAPSAKKEYPPMEVQTGVNTILLFYAYCVPVMSRGESLRYEITLSDFETFEVSKEVSFPGRLQRNILTVDVFTSLTYNMLL